MDSNARLTQASLAAKLLRWYGAQHRDLPWRRTRDPYRVWVSEIMLQQTRTEAVVPYYQSFLERFPNLPALAAASLEEVLTAWSGLGYYSRARNLHRAAVLMDGVFPSGYQALRQLPGIGDYTAAAIASIAFGLPYAVLDGNVMRVIARLTGDPSDIGAGPTQARFRQLAQQWLDCRHAGEFNQALMELGATVCLPRAPRCEICPLAAVCAARREGRQQQLPVKLRKTQPVKVDMAVAVVERRGRLLLWQRAADSRRLAGFWELPSPEQLPELTALREIGAFRHTITHHNYRVTVSAGSLPPQSRAAPPLSWIPIADLPALPLSTMARKALGIRRKKSEDRSRNNPHCAGCYSDF
ncbi:MAG TPA: A/G-specific adenine glycosylase [Bryobacteraceae bacterium]|nr:A/G-specific adenine glycosylase [Bryobacteraceae bacterium]